MNKRGRAHFAEIGKRGQLEMRRRYPNMARAWGQLGGRPKKPTLRGVAERRRSLKGGWDPPASAPPPSQ